VYVGICESTPKEIKISLEFYHKKKVNFVMMDRDEILMYLNREFGTDYELSGGKPENSQEEKIDIISEVAPAINLVNSILLEALKDKATDIHIEPGNEEAVVRFRIDGELKTRFRFEKEKFPAVSSRIKIMAGLNILETRLPQDGRISVTAGERKTDMRVSIIPVSGGESVVLRILGKSGNLIKLEDLGYSTAQTNQIRRLMKKTHGMILVSGPTGSGKTTTLNAILKELSDETKKIISIEDPVEYMVEGVCQIQVNEDAGLTFDSVLRRILRQDPDVIMVGEIRDRETAALSVRAALTGHLVFATVHTESAYGSIIRLKNLGIEPYLISAVLKGAVAQRLVKRKNMPGRIVVSEIIEIDRKTEKLTSMEMSQDEADAYLSRLGIKNIMDDAAQKISEGLTSMEEVHKELGLTGGANERI